MDDVLRITKGILEPYVRSVLSDSWRMYKVSRRIYWNRRLEVFSLTSPFSQRQDCDGERVTRTEPVPWTGRTRCQTGRLLPYT